MVQKKGNGAKTLTIQQVHSPTKKAYASQGLFKKGKKGTKKAGRPGKVGREQDGKRETEKPTVHQGGGGKVRNQCVCTRGKETRQDSIAGAKHGWGKKQGKGKFRALPEK